MLPEEYARYDALGLAALIQNRDVSAEELLDSAIDAVDRVNPKINAIIHRFEEHARQNIAAGLPDGPFHGVPFALKDLFMYYAGYPTGNGSRFWDGFVPQASSELFLRYARAGFVIFAKTSTPELGLNVTTEPLLHGATRNPWNLDYSTGGSSGGAAAAVAAGILPLAHASDSGGSIRIPASCCGLFGLKPSRGRMPLGPERGESSGGLGTAHAVGISVRDSAALLDATAGPDAGAPYGIAPPTGSWLSQTDRDPAQLRIGMVISHPRGGSIDASCRAATLAAAALCSGLGHEVEECVLPVNMIELADAAALLVASTTRAAIEARTREFGCKPSPDNLEPVTWRAFETAGRITGADFVQAQAAFHRAGRAIAALHDRYDVILTPMLAKSPARIGELAIGDKDFYEYRNKIADYSPFSALSNMTGAPAMSVPLFWSDDGLPIGVQFIGRFGDEATLFALAAQLERAQPWRDHRPPLAT